MDNKNKLIEIYDDEEVVKKYEISRFHSFFGLLSHELELEILNSAIRKYCEIRKELIICDVPIGTARIARNLNVKTYSIGVDASALMLNKANRSLHQLWFPIRASAYNLPIKENTVDIILTFRFLRHLRRNELYEAYSVFSRILKDSGILIFDMLNENRSQIVKLQEMFWLSLIFFYNIVVKQRKPQIVYNNYTNLRQIYNELRKTGFNVLKIYGIGSKCFVELFLDYITSIPLLSYFTRKIVYSLFFQPFLRFERKLQNLKSGCYEWVIIAKK